MSKDQEAAHKDADAKFERENDDDQAAESGTSGRDSGAGGGEDDSSTEIEGDDSHLHEDQKSRRLDV